MARRSMWTGSLSFGLVNVPVELVSAVRNRDVRFHQVERESGERIELRRVASTDGEPVPWNQIAHGWEEDDEMIVLTDAELASAAPEKTRTVDIDLFVELDAIDPIYFAHPYWLLPTGKGEGPARAYRLLRDVMQDSGRVAIGRIVLRAREYLVAVREQDGLLSLTTMRFAAEIRDPHDTGAIPTGETGKPSKREIEDAVALVEEMTDEFQPSRYEDQHRARLLALIAEKRKGHEIELPEREPEPVPQKAPADLIAALEDSLRKARGGGASRKPAKKQPAEKAASGKKKAATR
jgi:DNA end-binding protein Ku